MAELFESGGSEGQAGPGAEPDTAAVAIALDRASRRKGRGANDEVDRFLGKQEALIERQVRRLDEELHHMRLRHFSERLKVGLQLLTMLVGVLALAAVGAMAWSASRDNSLVIEGFGVPPDLAEQGTTGTAVASRLHDKLSEMQAQTVTVRAAVTVRDNSAARVKVEIPETGVSLGEVDQMLRQWLGHEVRVSGELSHVAAGPDKGALALSIRVGDEPGVRFVQADGDLEPLLQQAAEVVYRSRRPESYATWLDQHGRHEDAVSTLRSLTGVGSRADRAEALSQLAQMLNTSATIYERLDLQRRALQLTPGAGAAMVNLAGTEVNAGHSEAGLKQYVAQLKSRPPPGSTDEGVAMWPQLGAQGQGDLLGDYGPSIAFGCFLYGVKPCSIEGLVAASSANPGGVHPALTPQGRLSVIAVDVARAHAVAAADKLANQPRNWPATMAADLLDLRKGQWIAAATEVDRQREDWTALLARAPAYEALIGPYPGVPAFTAGRLNFMLALAKTGHGPEASAKVGATPLDCYQCLITRGQIAATLGDRAGAEKWFAEGARQGPSLPQADLEWGRLLLEAGQADAAIAHLQTAAQRGPKFSDPLEVWGEALLAKGDAAGAVRKFAAADRLTPWWGRLHLKWGEALARLGKTEDARAQLKTAAGLDLTADERAELTALKL